MGSRHGLRNQTNERAQAMTRRTLLLGTVFFAVLLFAHTARGQSPCAWTTNSSNPYETSNCTRVGVNMTSGTTPDAALHVVTSSSLPGFHINAPSGDTYIGPDSNGNTSINASTSGKFLFFATAGTERMRIDSGGNVGIGVTSAPAQKLTVAGGHLAVDHGKQPIRNHGAQSVYFRLIRHDSPDRIHLG